MKKVMILGAGYTQEPLYLAARRLGIRTVAASIPGDYPCFSLADEISYTDIKDAEALIRAGRDFQVDAVTSCGQDLMMAVIGPVCEALKLPGPPAEASKRASDKYYMKKAFCEGGVRTAGFERVSSVDDLKKALGRLALPVMIKAVDQNGSRGIIRCSTAEEAFRAFDLAKAVSGKDYLVCEEYIRGTLVGAEGMISGGEFVFLMPNETEIFSGATNIPVGHTVPLRRPKEAADIEEQVKKAAKALMLDECPVNCDLILADDGAYVVEMAGRSGANGLSELVSLHYGVDYYEIILKLALGEDVRPYFRSGKRQAAVSHILKSPVSGKLVRVDMAEGSGGEEAGIEMNVKPGDMVRAYTNCADRIGQIICCAPDPESAGQKVKHILDTMFLEVEVSGSAGVNRYPVL